MSFQNLYLASNDLKKQFQNFQHVDRELLYYQSNRFVILIRKFQDANIQLDNCNIIKKLLDSLPRGSN